MQPVHIGCWPPCGPLDCVCALAGAYEKGTPLGGALVATRIGSVGCRPRRSAAFVCVSESISAIPSFTIEGPSSSSAQHHLQTALKGSEPLRNTGTGLGGKGRSGINKKPPRPPNSGEKEAKGPLVESALVNNANFAATCSCSVPEGIQTSSSPSSLDTSAQLDKHPLEAPVEGGQDVESRFRKRARSKHITVPLAVSLAERRSSLEKSYRNTVYCSSVIVQEDGTTRSSYCKNRWCLVCSRIRTAQAINKYGPVIDSWDDPYFVTLTARNVKGKALEKRLGRMLIGFNSAKRSMKHSGVKLKAIRKLECTYNSKADTYHPHYHVVVEGPEMASMLIERWIRSFGLEADGKAQHMRECDEGALLEMFKYFCKLTCESSKGGRRFAPPHALDNIFQAMRGKRIWQSVGFVLPKEEDPFEEASETPAFKRLEEKVLWIWQQELSDWVDTHTGESFSGYVATEEAIQFVETLRDP